MSYLHIIEHVDGASNVWADMLSRWADQPTTTVLLKRFDGRASKLKPATTQLLAYSHLTRKGLFGRRLRRLCQSNGSIQRQQELSGDDNALRRRLPSSTGIAVSAYHRFWVSDNGSHFKNEVVAELLRRLKTHQTFMVAYCPWINGSVERVNRDILQDLRAMTMEYKISSKDWVYLVPLVQSSLNHTAVPSLGNKARTELFTGLPCSSPLAAFYAPARKFGQTASDLRSLL
ncbi:unnamed protein product [Phytophthora fragariaefolia]|uniref:Unnamed protein product n=1 Tax=Phytophthora fragariaefolia TaxID=1490495 RepID=A0A9W6XT48_9STRA|nr:unnamed protein product [Phytophthora fragariaefolia]